MIRERSYMFQSSDSELLCNEECKHGTNGCSWSKCPKK